MTHDVTRFNALNLSPVLLQALDDLKFQSPSPIQQQTIPLLLQGQDVIGQAQTGTGKTAAFALPILHSLNPAQLGPQALILAPTRELAIQVAEHFEVLSKYQRNVKIAVLCGGQEYRPQLKQLREGAQIIVGTPGRILDHLERGSLKLDKLSTLILDEADEMLRMGFIEDVETILASLPEKKQIALFSATMPTRIRQIAHRYLKEPASVEIRSETATVKSIDQQFLFASQAQKPDALLRILAVLNYNGMIVFTRTKSSTEEVATLLQQAGFRAMPIHGDLSQVIRERMITQFRQGAIDILVATDVAARGLDVERVTHVINYDMAQDCETYVHRIGRTGRAGRSGVTILFVTPKESRMLSMMERHTRQRIEKIALPTDAAIQLAKQQQFSNKITERLNHKHLANYRKMIENYLKEHDANGIDVAAALALMLNQDKLLSYENTSSKPSRPLKDSHKKGKEARTDHRQNQSPYTQELFRLEVGRVHGVKPGNIVGAIANEAGLQSRYITGLKIHDDHSIVRLPQGMPKEVVHGLNKAWVCGRQLKLTSLGIARG